MIAFGSWSAGCGTAAETSGGAVCTYAEVIACVTDSGCHSTQQCLPDLTGYGPCTCSGDAGVAEDAASRDASRGDGP